MMVITPHPNDFATPDALKTTRSHPRRFDREHPRAPVRNSLWRGFRRGQAMVETSYLILTAVFILVALIQGAILWSRSMAVVDLAYQGARYAAVNPSYDSNTVIAYMLQIAAPEISQNSGNQLSITISDSGTPRAAGTPITVTVVYTLPTPLAFGFPGRLNGSNTTMSE